MYAVCMEMCENCKFSHGKIDNMGLINCRRVPPTMRAGSSLPVFVKTYPKQWCGEWSPVVTEEMEEEVAVWAGDDDPF